MVTMVWVVLRQGRPAKVVAVCSRKDKADSIANSCDRFNSGTYQVIEMAVTE